MKESFWSLFILIVGIVLFFLMKTYQDITVNRDHDYFLLKEITSAAMLESVDVLEYRLTGEIEMDTELFRKSFYRRFAETTMSSSNIVNFYEISSKPPKVSVEIVSFVGFKIPFITDRNGETTAISTRVDQIIQTKY